MTDRLSVWWDGRISGCLYLGPDGETLFAYDVAWLAAYRERGPAPPAQREQPPRQGGTALRNPSAL